MRPPRRKSCRGTLQFRDPEEVGMAFDLMRQWNRAHRRCRSADAAAVGDPRSRRADGHEVQLRHRPVRRVHAARRWPGDPILQRPGVDGRRQAGDDDRRRLAGRQPSDPDRLEGIRHAAVRLLPVRHDHERARPAARAARSLRRRHRHAGHERLPLRHLSPRQAGDPPGRGPDEGATWRRR